MVIRRAIGNARRCVSEVIGRVRSTGKTKYFCIGRNKTGTTSIAKAFSELGFLVGDQSIAEELTDEYYYVGNFEPIIRYCTTAQVFQDQPFSLPETFKHLDKAFPGSRFILTIRHSSEEWYQSLTRFHAKKFGRNGQLPTANDLQNADYVRKGFMYNVVKLYGTSDEEPYEKEILIAHYDAHNQSVTSYFANRPGDLLVINVAEAGSYKMFAQFSGTTPTRTEFPWENRT